MKDNPNPRASIAIVCQYIFFYYAFESLYNNLENVEFVLDFTGKPLSSECPPWYREKMRDFFSKKGVYWRDFENSGLEEGEFFSKYGILIAPYHSGLVSHRCNKTKKKVRVFYGRAKDSWAFALWNVHFDLILCPSDFVARKMNKLYGVRAAAVGEPKHDRIIESLHPNFLSENGIVLNPEKKTVLYAPSWGALSSEDSVVPALLKLLPEYNVIYKPHHLTFLSNQDYLVNLKKISGLQIIDEAVSIIDLFKIVDVVISDNSSSIFDALAAKKPLVLIDMFGDSFENIYTETLFFKVDGNKFASTPTNANSLEQIIKKEGEEIAPVVLVQSTGESKSIDADKLKDAIKNSENDIFKSKQEKFSFDYMEKIDGFSGERSAKLIKEFINKKEGCEPVEMRQYVDEFEDKTIANQIPWIEKKFLTNQRISDIKKLPLLEKIKKIIETFFQ